MRLFFEIIPPAYISVIGAQAGNLLRPYYNDESPIAYFSYGTYNIDEMLKKGEEDNASATWALRLAGTTLMIFCFFLIFNPLIVMGRPVPLLGPLLSLGVGLASILLGISTAASVISTSWVFYNAF